MRKSNSLKPPLTKRPAEVGYWELNEIASKWWMPGTKKLIDYLR